MCWRRDPRLRAAHCSIVCLLLSTTLHVATARAAGRGDALIIAGCLRLPPAFARGAIGEPPADVSKRKAWAVRAVARVLSAYRQAGYTYARAWTRIDDRGRVVIEIDEGQMSFAFVGARGLRSLLYRVDLYLPDKIFHEPTLERSLDELRAKYGLANVYYRVTEQKPLIANRFGDLVKQRLLHIYVLSHEQLGWELGLSLNSTWGLVPNVSVGLKDVLMDDDRFRSELEIAAPYRRYVFQESPKFQWVHGRLAAEYRFPRLFGTPLAPALDASTALSRYSRSGQALESYLAFRGDAFASVQLLFPPILTIGIGGGVDFAHIFEIESTPPMAATSLLRSGARLEAQLAFDRGLRRRDQRNEINARASLGFAPSGDAMLNTRVTGQLVLNFGRMTINFGAKALMLTGDVRFWDEEPLAGDYLRTFFANRYWVRKALQLTIGPRFHITDAIAVGIFHDAAIFSNRITTPAKTALANSFGPALHFLLFDLFALDIYYGLGFAPKGFDHTVSFKLQSAF